MNEQEFRKLTEEFWYWVSKQERPASSWFLSLSRWAELKFNQTFEKERAEIDEDLGPVLEKGV